MNAAMKQQARDTKTAKAAKTAKTAQPSVADDLGLRPGQSLELGSRPWRA
jgi:hypothetical protein